LILELIAHICGSITTDIEALIAKSLIKIQPDDPTVKDTDMTEALTDELAEGKDLLYIDETDFDYIDLLESAAFATALVRQISGYEVCIVCSSVYSVCIVCVSCCIGVYRCNEWKGEAT
jgi:hypothetical protein